MKHMASAKRRSKSNSSSTKIVKPLRPTRFAICLRNADSEDLVVRKIYQVLPDERSEKDHFIRVVDESGEDYLYPVNYFFVIELPQKIERTLRRAIPVMA